MTERLSNKNPCNACKVDRQIGNPNRWQCECDRCDKPNDWKNECVKKLAEYETAEEDGRLVVIPYKIGMTLFLPRRREVLPFKVVGTRIYTNRTEIDLVYCGNNECYKFLSTHPTTEYIEREYYKTREEAKKALKEMEENQSE